MRIRMLQTKPGSPDGGRTLLYRAGEEYALGGTEREKELAAVFLREGWAEEVKSEARPTPPSPSAPTPSASRLAPQNSGLEKAPDAPPPGGQQYGGKHNRGR